MRIIWKLDFNSSQVSHLVSLRMTQIHVPKNAERCSPQHSSFRMVTHANYGTSPVCIRISKTWSVSLLFHRASCRFTKCHTTNKCTNCMSFIL